jgi:hypothetical protein
MKILFVASEGLPYSKTGGLADVIEGLSRALVEAGHEIAVLLPRYRGNKTTSVLISSVTMAFADKLRFPSIAEAKSIGGVRYFFVDDPEFFNSLPRLAISAGSRNPPQSARERSRRALASRRPHDSQSRLPGIFPTQYDAEDRPAGEPLYHGRARILRSD